ncbi:bifunctional DNA primase/polymerase [Streptomyces sp. 8N616]|uniref:bifunctional DNA primase/polymerase n=1 Tax=Streptomyces sp. 8N616 TaxID=3457414 RepID=UPI003FD5C562
MHENVGYGLLRHPLASCRGSPDGRVPPADARRHALAAAARGLPVIPLTRGKLPAVRSPHHADPEPVRCTGECGRAGHGIHDATTDPAAVLALFAAAPWATGYGIACGRAPHHLIGLDLDVKNGTDSLAALRRLAGEHGFILPPTVTVLTPSGGRHLWLTGPPGRPVPNSAGRLAPGIDVRGTGGYLVGPGSYSIRGVYRLAPGPTEPAPAPAPLVRLLTPPPARPGREAQDEQGPYAYGSSACGAGEHGPGGHGAGGHGAGGHGAGGHGAGGHGAGGHGAGGHGAGGHGAGGHGAGGHGAGGHGRSGAALVQFVRDSRPGQRNDRLFWAACRAYETGLGRDLAAALTDAALHTGLTEREARATIASAARHTGPGAAGL